MKKPAAPVVFIGMPQSKDQCSIGAARALLAASHNKKVATVPFASRCSILTYNFNLIWCAMLNAREKHGITHFAMVHTDVNPAPVGWLDTFLAEMERTKADVLSAVIPLKDDKGLTSTAIVDPEDAWLHRRLTLREVWERPETFTDPGLAVNTGLWLARLGPWADKICFRQTDSIVRRIDGTFAAEMVPEDWNFSRQCRELGLSLWATRKVAVEHEDRRYHTHSPWGLWVTDEAYEKKKAAAATPVSACPVGE